MLRSLPALFLIAITPALATAQAAPALPPQPQNSLSQRSITDWPNPRLHYGSHLDIVTLAAPGIRQSCRVRKLTADAITCQPPFYHAQTVFQRTDILALIEPPSFDNFFGSLKVALVVPLLVVCALLFPYGWVVDLGLLALGVFALFSRFAHHAPGDHLDDRLLYQRPGTTLTVPLHERP